MLPGSKRDLMFIALILAACTALYFLIAMLWSCSDVVLELPAVGWIG